jgi:DivIVA domain-containing protein
VAQPSDPSPEEIESASFPTRPRGYDRADVRAFLGRVADAHRRALEAGRAPRPMRELGEEVGGFLQHAHEVAEAMRREAESHLQEAVRDADAARRSAREEAAQELRTAAKEAEKVRAAALEQSRRARSQAERIAGEARSYATVVAREAAREAEQTRRRAEADARATLAAAAEEARLERERSERRVRHLQGLELALAQKVGAAEARLAAAAPSVSAGGGDGSDDGP